MIERGADALALSVQAERLCISRRSLYYQPIAPPEAVAIKHRIDALYTAHPFYGSRKLTVLLAENTCVPCSGVGHTSVAPRWVCCSEGQACQ